MAHNSAVAGYFKAVGAAQALNCPKQRPRARRRDDTGDGGHAENEESEPADQVVEKGGFLL